MKSFKKKKLNYNKTRGKMMDNGKREIDMLRKEIVEIHNNLAQNQTMLNNAAAKAAGNHSRLSESD